MMGVGGFGRGVGNIKPQLFSRAEKFYKVLFLWYKDGMDNNKKEIAVLDKISKEINFAEKLELTNSPSMRSVIEEECRKAGLDTSAIYECLKNGLSAQKVTTDKDGDEHWSEDWATRHKFMVSALELMGHLKHVDNNGGGEIDKKIAQQIIVEVRNIVVTNNYGGKT